MAPNVDICDSVTSECYYYYYYCLVIATPHNIEIL